MSARRILGTAAEWTFRTTAVREARTGIVSLDERRARALRQARLLLDVASLVKYPAGRLPRGARPAALIGLYRDATYWALAARRSADGEPPRDLAALWAEQDAGELARLVGGAAVVASARRVLLETPAARVLDASAEDATHAGALATALVGEVDAARKRANKLVGQRWMRSLLILVVLGGLGAGAYRLALGRDLASGARLRVSSTLSTCPTDPICNAMLFHTEAESSPWVELDLGAPKTIRRVEVTNRTDCCTDRAIPLVIEASTDRTQWTLLGRRDTDFATWTASFPPRVARYVKLSVPRHTSFHLQDVVIR